MASSSKVQFNLENLKEEALKSIDLRIEAKAAEVASHGDDAALDKLVEEWRARQETRISDLFSKLGDGRLRDLELASFRIEPMPKADVHERFRAQRELQELKAVRTQIAAKSSSLVPDEEGNISLTKTQLSEFFGL